MEKERILFQEYELMYINDGKNTIPSVYFRDLTPEQQQEQALMVIRFAIEEYLQWNPSDVKKYMTRRILKKMKLDGLLKSYVAFPPEYDKNDMDLTYLAYLLYPGIFKLNIEEQCINMFQRVYNREISKFPSSWIGSGDGLRRFAIILQYVLAQMPRFKDQEALYAYFAGPSGTKCLRKYRIYSFAITLYDSPLDALHFSLPDELRSSFWYHYFKFSKKYQPPCLLPGEDGIMR